MKAISNALKGLLAAGLIFGIGTSGAFAQTGAVIWSAENIGQFAKLGSIDAVIADYFQMTSLQQKANNQRMLDQGKAWRVRGDCSVMDVRESFERQRVTWAVDCRRDKPKFIVATLHFPKDAEATLLALKKGANLQYVADVYAVEASDPAAMIHGLGVALYRPTTGPAPPIPKLDGKGLDIAGARKLLFAAGWQPYEHPLGPGVERDFHASRLHEMGIREVQSCAGTGTAPCIFNYVKAGHCLRIITLGEDDLPGVSDVVRACPEQR